MELKTLYEDKNMLAIDKPAGIIVYPETPIKEKTLIDYLLEKYPGLKNVGSSPRYGIAHRLDRETSGVLLAAKNSEGLIFFQKQFKTGRVDKKYTALVIGAVKGKEGKIETLIGRSPKDRKKQKVFLSQEPGAEGKRKAITEYKVKERLGEYTLLEVRPKTGRKHQIRCHLAYLGHPIAGDKIYGFKNQPSLAGLKRQFLHASYIRIETPDGKIREFESELPGDLKEALSNIK